MIDHDPSNRQDPPATDPACRRIPSTARTFLGPDFPSPGTRWRVAEMVTAYVASKVDFPLDQHWVLDESRVARLLHEAVHHAEEFLASRRARNRRTCLALASHLEAMTYTVHLFKLVDNRARDDAMAAVAALTAAANAPEPARRQNGDRSR